MGDISDLSWNVQYGMTMTGIPQILNSVVYILCREILKLFFFPKEGILYSCSQFIASQNVCFSQPRRWDWVMGRVWKKIKMTEG